MDFQRIITIVEYLFPSGTKRRRLVNIPGIPVARLLGFQFPTLPARMPSAQKHPAIPISQTGDAGANWESIKNFIDLKMQLFLSDHEGTMVFPEFERPVVSILLVTFNKAEYTFQCLETIKAHADIPYEVIIVDNASSDSTIDLINRTKNIKVIKQIENIGFLRGCNQGARDAKGEFILFLNNDTQVGPSFLSKLVDTVRGNPGCGAVGAKLVFPNGLLQEAGSIVWKDGSTMGYGRNDDPFRPEYSYLKQVDYCSGACLLVKKDLFFRLEGFDERFAPAYYEDLDVCFGFKRMGFEVIYQPEVSVVHYEHGSSSFKSASALSVGNRRKFFEKWSNELDKSYSSAAENVLLARDSSRNKSIMVVDGKVPSPSSGDGSSAVYELLIFLADRGCKITFVPLLLPEPLQPFTRILQQKRIEVIYGKEQIDFVEFMKSRKKYYDMIYVGSPHNTKELLAEIKKYSPDSEIVYDAGSFYNKVF